MENVRASGLTYVVDGIARSAEALARLRTPDDNDANGDNDADQAVAVQEQETRPEPKDELVESYLASWD